MRVESFITTCQKRSNFFGREVGLAHEADKIVAV